MLKLGNKSISNLFIGQKAAMKAFLGQKLVWQKATGLPYDAEVEYLESTGTQYINTGIIPTIDTICDIDCMSITFVGWGGIVGSCTSDNSADSYYFRQSGAVSVKGYSATVDGKSNVNQILVDDGVKALCHLSKDTFEVNGTIKTLGATAYSVSPSLPMFMFAVNLGGSPWIYRLFKGRIFSCKIYNGNILVRDFIPVRVGGVGYMYDRVSKQLFGNQGSGNFIVGPDVVEVEYLESTGTQYIDTGIKYKSTYSVRLNYTRVGQGVGGSVVASTSTTQPLLYFPALNANAKTDRFVWRRAGYSEQSLFYDFNSYPYTAEVYLDAQNDVLYVNGEAKKTGMVSGMGGYESPYESTSNIYLFAISGTYGGMSRIYSFSVEENGIKKIDLIPVRVGMEGAMKDKVTGKIYRNQGTGAFKIGADKKETPLMCNSYVKDGLVAMWDGVENAGWGTHDANATTWKDLTGNHVLSYEFTPSFTDNAFELPGTDKVAYCESNLWRDAVNSNQCTVEMCFKGYSVGGNNSVIALSRGTTSNVERAWWQWGNVAFGYRLSTGSTWSNDTLLPRGETDGVSLSFPLADMYMNGTKVMTGSPGTLTIQSNTLVIGRIGSFKSTINGFVTMRADIHSIRIYNKVLTAEEIAWNCEIDRRRFNLT